MQERIRLLSQFNKLVSASFDNVNESPLMQIVKTFLCCRGSNHKLLANILERNVFAKTFAAFNKLKNIKEVFRNFDGLFALCKLLHFLL